MSIDCYVMSIDYYVMSIDYYVMSIDFIKGLIRQGISKGEQYSGEAS